MRFFKSPSFALDKKLLTGVSFLDSAMGVIAQINARAYRLQLHVSVVKIYLRTR
jgi:hypothetical protein